MNVESGSKGRLRPEGRLGIERASGLKTEILERLSEGAMLEFDLSSVEDIDLPCVQVLYAARREADRRNSKFTLVGTLSERVAKRLVDGGFIPAMLETGSELERALVGWAVEGS